MLFSKSVGVFLSNEREDALVRAAIAECGLVPVDWPDMNHRFNFDTNPHIARNAAESVVATIPEPRLAVTDDESAIDQKARKDRGNQWNYDSSLVLLVQDGGPTVGRGGENSGPFPASEDYPWLLPRPLRGKAVREQLRKAEHASRVFEERDLALLDELHRARRILESMSNGITLSDSTQPDHPLVYVNPAFERITGYSASESCGRNSRFLQNGDSNQPDLPKIREAIEKQTEVQALVKNYRKDGTPFWNEFYMSPIFDIEGRLTHFVGFQNDVTARVEAARQVERLASHDTLTGLANRETMMERLRQALPRALRAGGNVAVLFFDLNNFKYVNDEFGHGAGDDLLRTIAGRFQRDARSSEMVARIGGDEFVAVIEDITSELQAVDILERLSTGLSEPYDLCGQEFHPSASIGLAIFPRDGKTPEALLKAADSAMYEVKDIYHRARPRIEVGELDRL